MSKHLPILPNTPGWKWRELMLCWDPECWKFHTEPNVTAEWSIPENKGGLLEILKDTSGYYDKTNWAPFLFDEVYCIGLMHKTSWFAGTLPCTHYFFRFFNAKERKKKKKACLKYPCRSPGAPSSSTSHVNANLLGDCNLNIMRY